MDRSERRVKCLLHLAVAHGLVVVSIRQQHVEQSFLQAFLCATLKEDVVREGSMHVCHKQRKHHRVGGLIERRNVDELSVGPTCVDGFLQLGIMLHLQQSLVITRLRLQLFLSAARCHPDLGAVLVGHAFTHVSLHCQNRCEQLARRLGAAAIDSTCVLFICTCDVLLNSGLVLKQFGPSL